MKNSTSRELRLTSVRVPVHRILLVAGLLLSLSLAPITWASTADDDVQGPNWVEQLVSWVTQWFIGPEDSTHTGEELTLMGTTANAEASAKEEDAGASIDPSGQPAN